MKFATVCLVCLSLCFGLPMSSAFAYDARTSQKSLDRLNTHPDPRLTDKLTLCVPNTPVADAVAYTMPPSNIQGTTIYWPVQARLDWNVSLQKLQEFPEDSPVWRTPEFRYMIYELRYQYVLLNLCTGVHSLRDEPRSYRIIRNNTRYMQEMREEQKKLQPKCTAKRLKYWQERLAIKWTGTTTN